MDGVVYSFLGDKEFHETIGQTGVDVTATSTTYTFENEKIILNVKFTSPLLLDDLTLVSRPCTYIDYAVEKKENCDVMVAPDKKTLKKSVKSMFFMVQTRCEVETIKY